MAAPHTRHVVDRSQLGPGASNGSSAAATRRPYRPYVDRARTPPARAGSAEAEQLGSRRAVGAVAEDRLVGDPLGPDYCVEPGARPLDVRQVVLVELGAGGP